MWEEDKGPEDWKFGITTARRERVFRAGACKLEPKKSPADSGSRDCHGTNPPRGSDFSPATFRSPDGRMGRWMTK